MAYVAPLRQDLPDPVDLSHHLSESGSRRTASDLKRFYKYFRIPGIIQLAGGLPYHRHFPFDTLESSTATPGRWDPSAGLANPSTESRPPVPEPASERLIIPGESSEANLIRKVDLKTALQYGGAQGYAPLDAWIRTFTTQYLHPNILYKGGVETHLTCGNTDGFSKVLDAFTNVWREDKGSVDKESLICEEFCYPLAINATKPRALNVVSIKTDAEGMLAEGKGGLGDVLANWDPSRGKRPHLIYLVSIGQNPTGVVYSTPRRKAIYALCVKFDVIIVEDEPYWFLQYPSASAEPYKPQQARKKSGSDFLDSLAPSFLSVDYQGRVLRLDSFSKAVAPGCRLGWITGQPALIQRIQLVTETNTAQPSGFVQGILAELILGPEHADLPQSYRQKSEQRSGWDMKGWLRWLEGLRGEYERRMNLICDELDKGRFLVKSGRRPSIADLNLHDEGFQVVEKVAVIQYKRPAAGMFIWIEILFENHPLIRRFGGAKLAKALWVFWTKEPYLVLVAPGDMFAPSEEVRDTKAWRFFRLTFISTDLESLPSSGRNLVEGIQAFWKIKQEGEIQRLLDEVEETGLEDPRAVPYVYSRFC